MKVVLLCHNMHTAGGYTVGINFVRSLKAAAGPHRFLITVPPGVGYESVELPGGSDIFVYRGGRSIVNRWIFDCHRLPNLLKRYEPDVIFAMGNLGVTLACYKQAILFHDSHLIYPSKHYAAETYRARVSKWLVKKRMKDCLKYTDLIFCQTPVTKARFARVYNYPSDRIRIMPNAVSEFSKIDREKTESPKVFDRNGYFNLFFLTKFCAHKNLEVLIDIFRRHPAKLRDIRCIVTVAADQHANAPRFLKSIRRYNLEEHIVNVGPLKQEELVGYFYNCDVLFFPTLLESFSGTYLEAMHFGLPILTSDLDFAHYVCGDSAVYFDPWNVEDIVDKILTVKNNFQLREELIRKGKKRGSSFFKSWQEIVADVIRELELLVNRD